MGKAAPSLEDFNELILDNSKFHYLDCMFTTRYITREIILGRSKDLQIKQAYLRLARKLSFHFASGKPLSSLA